MRHAATTQAHASGPSIRLPANALYITIAALILVGLVAWVGGVQWGKSKEAARAEKELAAFRDRPSPADPLAHETGTGRETKQNATALPPPKPAVDQNQGAQAPAAVTPRGLTGTDPREAGKNYLALVTTNAAEVQAAVTFLAANGIDAFAIPLESSGSGAKNQGPDGRYRLYALPGITPEQLKQNDSMKKSIESKIAQLAARWKKEYRGGSDFSSAQWMKYSGN